MKLAYLPLSILIISFPLFAQEHDDPGKNQQPQTFSLNPNDLGALENSVNLFTGQVTFPMNLVSLPGRGGLSVSVNIQYNSNVKANVDRWNADSPTGILGLGWSLDIPKIVVNHKSTGARADDDFYLIEGGQSKKLVCINSSGYPRRYEIKSSDLWKIEYYSSDEKWVITRENGFKYVYGDRNNRGSIQWMVRWGNWIGDSSMPTGQEQQAYIWNLSEVQNLWSDKLRFEYENVEEFVAKDLSSITSEKKHTKASYLKRITDPVGYSVEFLYGEKFYVNTYAGKKEYQDPHSENIEPDAYQEKYETRFLDRLIITNETGTLLYETDLEYNTDLIGSADKVKRVLTSIKNIYPSGKAMPPVKFEYFTQGDFVGSLQKVVNTYGAYYEYTYQKSIAPLSELDITVDAPTPGSWQEHYVYTAHDYVIVVWRTVNSDGSHNSGSRPCRVWLYHWDGQWHKQDLTADGDINIKSRKNDDNERVLDWQIVLENDFFAFLYPNSEFNRHDAYIYYRKESTGNDWNFRSIYTPYETPRLISGENFVAIAGLHDRVINTYVFNGDGISFQDIDASDSEAEYFVSAANNYIFVHNDNGSHQDYIHLFYLDEEKRWQKSSAPLSQLFRTDGDGFRPAYWYSFNSFTMGLPWDNEEFIYMWNENYGGIKRSRGWGRQPDDSYILSRNNSTLSLALKDEEADPFNNYVLGRTARYDGNLWQFSPEYYSKSNKNFSYGTDFIILESNPALLPREAYLYAYDPNNRTWSASRYFHYPSLLNTKGGLLSKRDRMLL